MRLIIGARAAMVLRDGGGLYLRSERASTRRAEGWGGGVERPAAAARGASANDGQYTITTTDY